MDFINSSASKKLTQQHIKAMHLKQIYLALLNFGELSRAQLKDHMELSFPSVSALVDELIGAGILEETDMTEKLSRGRPRIMLTLRGDVFAVPAVKLTRHGYEYRIYNSKAELLEYGRLPFTNGRPSAECELWRPSASELCEPLVKWLRTESEKYRLCDLVFCLAGNKNADGALSSSSLRLLSDVGVYDRLADETGKRIVMMNDSDCAAYAEKLHSGIDEDFVYIYIGKGVGAGIIRSGRIFGEGMDVRAGEIGHTSIDHNGRLCECGSRGCLERYISTPVIVAEAADILGETDFDSVASEYIRGNAEIAALIDEKARLLAFGISNMLMVQPVTKIVLGGGIEVLGEGFIEALKKHLGAAGLRRYSERVTLSYTKNPDGDIFSGALRNYLEHKMKIETLI